ncbi:hypothetical protein Q2T40_09310 [Winogradskyella maritima]|uniref:Uncharacterized protein n=1 Tax=Winogradskyella maritima TaxID=1517766 RepID=A0ABV8ALX0_9FLAO|nr:hypothetical protein [Winogradskyella maritima]
MENFGDKLYNAVSHTRMLLFTEGELANLTVIANNRFIELIEEEKDEPIKIDHPVGWRADNTPINSTNTYSKEELTSRYRFMSETKLPLDAIYRLVTITETLLNYIFKSVLIEFPGKIPSKRKIDASIALGADSIDSIKIDIVNSILNEIAYKSPKEYAEEFNKFVGINLLENPIFHRFIELKATRDIHIHNGGNANDIYISKAGPLARVKSGFYLPVSVQYFLQSYESCIQLTEILENELHKIWPSAEFIKYKESTKSKEKEQVIEENIEQVIEESQKKIEDSKSKE